MTPILSPLPPAAAFTGQGLTCLRGGRVVFTALDFALEPGDALLLLGPNGSGKSSLLRLMALLLKPLHGSLRWGGRPLQDDPDSHRGRLHYVGHLDAVKPVLTALENLDFWATLAGADAPRRQAQAALTALGVAHIADLPGRYLSAGQKRRLNLARLLAAPAPLWLLDEPTVALDVAAIALLEQAIAAHRRAGGMVALSTHAAIALPAARTLRLDRFAPAFDPEEEPEDGPEEEPETTQAGAPVPKEATR